MRSATSWLRFVWCRTFSRFLETAGEIDVSKKQLAELQVRFGAASAALSRKSEQVVKLVAQNRALLAAIQRAEAKFGITIDVDTAAPTAAPGRGTDDAIDVLASSAHAGTSATGTEGVLHDLAQSPLTNGGATKLMPAPASDVGGAPPLPPRHLDNMSVSPTATMKSAESPASGRSAVTPVTAAGAAPITAN
jgi:hypothetical protein